MRSTSNGYYDRHRIAKGDLGGEREFTLVINGDQALGNAILDGVGVKMLNDIDGNPVEFSFIDVATRARFGPPAWFGNTPAKDRKRIDRERDDAVYTVLTGSPQRCTTIDDWRIDEMIKSAVAFIRSQPGHPT